MKKIIHILEYILALILYAIFRVLPLDASSFICGKIVRHLAVFHKTSLIANNNLKKYMPEMTAKDRKRCIALMWENWGRTVGEYPHINRPLMQKRISIEDPDKCCDEIKESDKGAIVVGAHVANLELAPLAMAMSGTKVVCVYRKMNNPYIDNFLLKIRLKAAKELYPKGKEGAVNLIKALRNGETAGILVDQKMNNGIAVPFFGEDAMTAPAVATMALKYDLPLYAGTMVREKGVNFTFKIERLTFDKTGDTKNDTLDIMTKVNLRLEQWIKEHPEQWFWMHNRWGKLKR